MSENISKEPNNLFNNDYLELFNSYEQNLLKELSTKHCIKDEDFEKYSEILHLACNTENEKIRNYMSKGFWKTGFYGGKEIKKIVCLTRCSKLIGEDWKPVKIWDKDKHTDTEYNYIQVSNYGRVRVFSDKYFEILPQYENEEKDKDEKLNSKDYRDGYLYVNLPKAVKVKNEYKSTTAVYELIAEYWLKKEGCDKKCFYDIHHINNNGYENTPANLIWLKKCQHKQVHPNFNIFIPDTCKKCLIQKAKKKS